MFAYKYLRIEDPQDLNVTYDSKCNWISGMPFKYKYFLLALSQEVDMIFIMVGRNVKVGQKLCA